MTDVSGEHAPEPGGHPTLRPRGAGTRGPANAERPTDVACVLPPPFVMPFRPGDVLVGKYEVNDLIGVGGIAFVISARHTGFDNFVALKFLRPDLAHETEALRRFTAEAQNNFRLQSEHIVRVLDVDTLGSSHGFAPFMVMELLPGRDLRSVLARGPLTVEAAVEVVLQVAEALATAHASAVVHCDIKPENLFSITRLGLDTTPPEPLIKVLDFGISRAVRGVSRESQSDKDGHADALGSPPYMSPEQVHASPHLDARTDIWSLGCVLYELLALRVPFHRQTRTESCVAVLEHEPEPIRNARPDVPAGLEAVISRCLQKRPDQRFPNVAELAEALLPFAPPRARRHALRARALLSPPGQAIPRPATATGEVDHGALFGPEFATPRSSSPSAFVPTEHVGQIPETAQGTTRDPALLRRRQPQRTVLITCGAVVAASLAFVGLRYASLERTVPHPFSAATITPIAPAVPPLPVVSVNMEAPLPPQDSALMATTSTAAAPVGATHPATTPSLAVRPRSSWQPRPRAPLGRRATSTESDNVRPVASALESEPDVGF